VSDPVAIVWAMTPANASSATRATSTSSAAARRTRPAFRCAECGWSTAKWVGRCGECQEWGTVAEVAAVAGPRTTASSPLGSPALPIGSVPVDASQAVPTGVGELDRVLGGGLVPGAVVLVAGEPGIGKSTLLLDVAGRAAAAGRTALYVTGEESAGQVRLRAERIGAMHPGLLLAAETDLGLVLGHLEHHRPAVMIVDSVQTVASANVDGAAGGVTQVREVAGALIAAAKAHDVPVLLVGHVTKDGTVAGPRTLEHLVDVVCQFEGDRHARLRLVRAVKNRYGPTDEVGCFELSERGILGLDDPSGLFLSRSAGQVPGTCITVTLEGRRPLTLEIQSLTVASALTNARRTTSGLDSSRLAMILAVVQRHLKVPLTSTDVYVSTVGGARVTEPASDVAVALAIISALEERALRDRLVAFGEVSLSGDLRPVTGIGRRLAEASRLGFTRAIVPRGSLDGGAVAPPSGMTVLEADTLVEAAALASGSTVVPVDFGRGTHS